MQQGIQRNLSRLFGIVLTLSSIGSRAYSESNAGAWAGNYTLSGGAWVGDRGPRAVERDEPSEPDAITRAMRVVERRLGIALALLMLGILGILGATVGQPAVQYVAGSETRIEAAMGGSACGSHLEWSMESSNLNRGSRVAFVNETVYWQISVVIERWNADGTIERVAESPVLRDGEEWKYTFWKGGNYRIVSADETQRVAGLDAVISVK